MGRGEKVKPEIDNESLIIVEKEQAITENPQLDSQSDAMPDIINNDERKVEVEGRKMIIMEVVRKEGWKRQVRKIQKTKKRRRKKVQLRIQRGGGSPRGLSFQTTGPL